MHEPHARGFLLFRLDYRRRHHGIHLPRFRHSVALRHDLDFAGLLASVRRSKLQCAAERQSAKRRVGQVLRALENHHPYGNLRFRLRAARKIPLRRHVRPPFGIGHRRRRARGYGGRCFAGQELRLRHHIPHGPAAYGRRAHHSFGIRPVRLLLGQLLRHRRLHGILDSHHAHSGQHLLPLRRFGDMALRH